MMDQPIEAQRLQSIMQSNIQGKFVIWSMMVIKIDNHPSPAVLAQLAQIEQIRKVFALSLPELTEQP